MRYLPAGLLALSGLGLFSGCAGVAENYAEREIIRRAPELIGPADNYQARVRRLSATHADVVRLVGMGVRPTSGLILRQVQLHLCDVSFQRNPFHVTRVGSMDFTAQVTDGDLNACLLQAALARHVAIRNVRLTFTQNGVELGALVPVSGQEVQVSTSGILQPIAGTRVDYLPQRLTVGGVALSPVILQQLANRVNPVLDLSGLRYIPLISQVVHPPGRQRSMGLPRDRRCHERIRCTIEQNLCRAQITRSPNLDPGRRVGKVPAPATHIDNVCYNRLVGTSAPACRRPQHGARRHPNRACPARCEGKGHPCLLSRRRHPSS